MNIVVKDLAFWYKPTRPIFSHLNLTLPLQSWVALTGESGVGKSTLVRLLAGLLAPKRGEIVYPPELRSASYPQIGFLEQNCEHQLVQLSVERELAFDLENAGVPVPEMHRRVEQALSDWRLACRRDAALSELSGGEKQRLALAGLMMSPRRLLILDEPTSNLDIETRLEFYQEVRKLYNEGVSIIWVTQDEYELSLAEKVLILNLKEELVWN